MLGGEIRDPYAVEGPAQGLGVLPYSTEFQREKRYRHAIHTFAPLSGFWQPLSGLSVEAYEIRHGHTRPTEPGAYRTPPLEAALPEHCGWQHGQTLAIYLHGMFENPAVMRGLFGRDTPTLDDTFNGLADFIDAHFARGMLMSLLK
jgi:adenosylcobyric acid synthase